MTWVCPSLVHQLCTTSSDIFAPKHSGCNPGINMAPPMVVPSGSQAPSVKINTGASKLIGMTTLGPALHRDPVTTPNASTNSSSNFLSAGSLAHFDNNLQSGAATRPNS